MPISSLQGAIQKALDYLHSEFAGLQTGRASTTLVEGLVVSTYGSTQPLKNISNISTPDAKTIMIAPWDASLVPEVEKIIIASDLGMTPNNNGKSIILNIPPMTEERRKEIVKLVHKYSEDAKISVRNARHDAMKQLDTQELSEDEEHQKKDEIQKKVDDANTSIDTVTKAKEADIMKV